MKKIALFALGMVYLNVSAEPYPFHIDTVASKSGESAKISIVNNGSVPVTLKVEPSLTGYKLTGNRLNVNEAIVIPPFTKKPLFSVVSNQGYSLENFSLKYNWTYSNGTKPRPDSYVYPIPFEDQLNSSVEKLFKVADENTPERYVNAYHITSSSQSEIIASRPGTVFDLRVSEADEPNESDSSIGAYIKVMHSDGTWSEYFGLPYDSISAKINQHVDEGDVIATSKEVNFAVMYATDAAVAAPVSYEFSLKTGAKLRTQKINDHIQLKTLDPNNYQISPWLTGLFNNLKNNTSTQIILAFGILFLVLFATLYYFYIRYKKIKEIRENEKNRAIKNGMIDDDLLMTEEEVEEIARKIQEANKYVADVTRSHEIRSGKYL